MNNDTPISNSKGFAELIGTDLVMRARGQRRRPSYQPKVGDWVRFDQAIGEVIARDGLVAGCWRVEFYDPDGSINETLSMRPEWLVFLGTTKPADLMEGVA